MVPYFRDTVDVLLRLPSRLCLCGGPFAAIQRYLCGSKEAYMLPKQAAFLSLVSYKG